MSEGVKMAPKSEVYSCESNTASCLDQAKTFINSQAGYDCNLIQIMDNYNNQTLELKDVFVICNPK